MSMSLNFGYEEGFVWVGDKGFKVPTIADTKYSGQDVGGLC